MTKGLFLGALENETVKELSAIQNLISGTGTQLCHPLFVPLLLCEILLDKDLDEVKRHSSNLLSVGFKTRVHSYPTREESISQKAKRRGEPYELERYQRETEYYKRPELPIYMDIDFDSITKSLNRISIRLSFHQTRVETSLHFLTSIEDCEKYFRRDDDLASSQLLKTRLAQTEDDNVSLLSEIQFNQRKAQTQLEVFSISTVLIPNPL